ncbi:Zn(2)-C6 fungal-type domain-containing protein [Favolaschia claudopus]|uniref:Zn(2)-C6 fungal-type domain-containing protein n=1 Tax=Favolaschia claudopus TaxID=2862362 RepID=A0AAW0CU15_9AGAR
MTKGSMTARTRGPYATQACIVCRAKKSKCDGVQPECGPCVASGRSDECAWGRDKKSRVSRVESYANLRKRADSLHARVLLLQSLLEKCTCQDVSYHLQTRAPSEQSSAMGEGYDSEDSDTESEEFNSDQEITQELTVPAQRLKLDDRSGGLLHQGITAPNIVSFGNRLLNEVPQNAEIHNSNATYELQLDVADIFNPEIDWSRYLPPEVPMFRRQHDKILDLSFKFFTPFMCRVVPSLFLRDMYRALRVPRSEEPPRTPHYSPMLHNALLALCAVFSDEPHLRDPRTRQHFVLAAQARMFEEIKRPNLSIVLALEFIGSFYAADKDDQIQAELFFGMSIRMSMTLGLGLDSTPWVKAGLITHDEMVGRNCAHWNIFSLDVCWALLFGREFGGPPHRDTPMPFVDEELDQEPWYHAPANIPPQPNYYTLTFNKTSALFMIARQITDIVNGLRPSGRSDCAQTEKQVAKIDLELSNWRNQLPLQLDITSANQSQSTPQRLMLHLAYWWCCIILHRPFFCRPKSSPGAFIDHVKLCVKAAEKILDLVQTWSSLYNLRHSSLTLQQVIFSAGTIFLLRALQASAGPSISHDVLDRALAQTEMCIEYMHEMGQTWESAIRTANLLHWILNDKLRPVVSRRLAQTKEQNVLGGRTPSQVESQRGSMPLIPTPPPAMPSYTSPLNQRPSPIANEIRDFFTELQDARTSSDPDASYGESLMAFPGLDMDRFLLPNYLGAWEHQDFSQHTPAAASFRDDI